MNSTILRLDENFKARADGPLDLKDAFFDPDKITDYGGIEPILRGLVYQRKQQLDAKVIDDLRNSLFGTLDLASINIQRGRDHGLPDYNTVRLAFGLEKAETFLISLRMSKYRICLWRSTALLKTSTHGLE